MKRYCIPEKDSARFVSQMERVLDLYAEPPDPLRPLVCMDEASRQLLEDVYGPLPMEPATPRRGAEPEREGKPKREDYHYRRKGTRCVFLFFAPHLGWRRVAGSVRRTRKDWAREVKRLLDEDFPDALKVRLVSDNLNTHDFASLYEAFPAEEAHRLMSRLELHHTPRNGSWLNMAEVELSVLGSDCLDRRIPDARTMDKEMAAWEKQRNATKSTVRWQFTTPDARTKLGRLYPQF